MKNKLHLFAVILAAGLGGLALAGCNGTSVSTLVQDASGVVATAAATASDIFTVANAVEQNNTGKPVTAAQIVSDAEAGATALNSSGLASTAQSFASSVIQTYNDAKAAGESQSQIVSTVAAQTAAAQVAAANVVSVASPTASAYWKPSSGSHFRFLIVKDTKGKTMWRPKAVTYMRPIKPVLVA